MSLAPTRLCVLLVLLAAGAPAACSGGRRDSGTPLPPTSPAPVPPAKPDAPADMRVSVDVAARTVTVTWQAAARAKTYSVAVGSAPGLSDVSVQSTADTTLAIADLPIGRYFIRVAASNDGSLSDPSRELPAIVIDAALADYIEALFMGSGPLIPRDGATACVLRGTWATWAQGTTVRVRVSLTSNESMRNAVRRTVGQIREATMGAVDAAFELVDDPDPLPNPGDVTETLHPSPATTGCATPWGCVHIRFQGTTISNARAVLDKTVTYEGWPHELGHAILGMCHVDGFLIGNPRNSMMSGGPNVFSNSIADSFTVRDIEAARAVYSAMLAPLASRADFMNAGLIKRSTGSSLNQSPGFASGGVRVDEPLGMSRPGTVR